MKLLTVDVKETANALIDASTVLTEREKHILRMRFGLGGALLYKREHTLQEIANRLRVTRERIRQIEAKALRKLKPTPPALPPA